MSGLFTVLLAEKKYIDAIRQENKLFFEPFLENKEIAFCYWNPSGQNLLDSAPGLLDAVGRRKEWRAVILNNCTEESIKTRNPFDVVDHSAVDSLAVPKNQPDTDESLESWEAGWKAYFEALTKEKEAMYQHALEHPLQKLTTWLCFRPEDYILNEVKEKQDYQDWAMEIITKDEVKPSVRLEQLERQQYKRELRMKELLRRAFASEAGLNIAYPTEVYCISTRTSENNFFDPATYWNIRKESEYSAFADRNMYFDRMRFMVFDLLPKTHRNFRTDYIRFLACVLIFISNPVPGSAMQARRLYHMEAETDDTPLCTLVTSYDKKLASTSVVIDNEMEKIRSEIPEAMTDKDAEALFCKPQDVAVLLDESCDVERIYAEKNYGLFYDSPENESHKWNRDYRASKKELAYIVKQQARSVRKSVEQTHRYSEVSDTNISRLTSFQLNDVRDYTDAAEDEMVASIPVDLTDISRYTERMDEESEKVKKVIRRRMTKKTTMILSALSLVLYLICFLPFLLSNNNTPKTITTAVILTGSMLGLLAVILLIALFAMRSTLRKAVRSYNNVGHEIMKEIQMSMDSFSKYLSASCNVRRGHAVQNYAQGNVDEYTKSLRIRKKHKEDIRKKRVYLAEEYRDYFGDSSFCDETMASPYDYDFDQKTEYAYPAPFLAGDCRQIEFMSSGNFVTVPSSYVKYILVRMEGIYEE